MIRRAKNTDISTVEEILFDAVMWMKSNGISNLWSLESVKWAALSREYKIDDFYIYFDKNKPVACMAITNKDSKYWPNVEENSSLYLHKLAVKKEARGNGISKEMIDFIKEKAYAEKINEIRLDCNANVRKLCKLYEAQGFKYVESVLGSKDYNLALYVYYLK